MSGLPGSGGLNDPANWGWYSGTALRLQQERAMIHQGRPRQRSYGGDEFKVKVGAAYDEQYRLIRGYDNDRLGYGEAGCNIRTDHHPARAELGQRLRRHAAVTAGIARLRHRLYGGLGADPSRAGPD